MIKDAQLIIDQDFIEKRPLSNSSLKEFRRSPKHYIEYIKTPFIDTDATILGKAIECLVLEKEKYKEKFVIADKPDLRSLAAKEAWNTILIEADINKKTVISTEKNEIALICAENLLTHPDAKLYIENRKKIQIKLNWRNKETNLPCLGFADFESIIDEQEFVCDIKAFYDADPDRFSYFIKERQMYLQAGMYLDAYHKIWYRFPDFIFILVETQPPYNVTVEYCDNKFVEIAKEEFFGTLKAFRYCMNNNQFHMGYEFRLFGTKDYFRAEIPKYYSPKFADFQTDEL